MKSFFGPDLLLNNESAKKIYAEVKDLPIIDYHCHLDQYKIKDDAKFQNIGELWLSGDHYKWRAMRLSGVGEELITGSSQTCGEPALLLDAHGASAGVRHL